MQVKEFSYEGIKRIEIPKLPSDFAGGDYGLSILKKYMPSILSAHKENADKEEYLFRFSNGRQDIDTKERLYQKDNKNNNKIKENHAFRQKSFKVGFITQEHRSYTHKQDVNTDDLIYLDRYFTDVNFFEKDDNLKEWIYATGIGVTYTAPRTDIINENGYVSDKALYDVEYESPFVYEVCDPREDFVVYSSSKRKEPLFCVSIVDVDVSGDNEIPETRKQIQIETRYATFEVQSNSLYSYFFNDIVRVGELKALNYLPIIEYSCNMERIGVVELNRDSFNLINSLKSATIDMVIDNANAILVFKNADVTADDVQKMKEAGAIIISDNKSSRNAGNADLDTITVEIPFEGINKFYEESLTQAYDIAGVPLATSNVTSGGDTGQARLIGGGWSNAEIIAGKEINCMLRGDYDELKLILYLCRQVPKCPLNELFASQINIKYKLNKNDNFLVKTQGMLNLFQMNMPKKEIVQAGNLFPDEITATKNWEEYSASIVENDPTKTVIETAVDNNSQE